MSLTPTRQGMSARPVPPKLQRLLFSAEPERVLQGLALQGALEGRDLLGRTLPVCDLLHPLVSGDRVIDAATREPCPGVWSTLFVLPRAQSYAPQRRDTHNLTAGVCVVMPCGHLRCFAVNQLGILDTAMYLRYRRELGGYLFKGGVLTLGYRTDSELAYELRSNAATAHWDRGHLLGLKVEVDHSIEDRLEIVWT